MRSAWVVGAFDLDDLREWLAQKQDIPWPARQWFLDQASAASLGLPAFAGVHELMLVNGSYMQLSLFGRSRRDHVVAISLVVVTVSFDVYWTNFLWEWLECPVSAQAPSIIGKVKDSIHAMGILQSGHGQIDDASLFANFGIPHVSRMRRAPTFAFTASITIAASLSAYFVVMRFDRIWAQERMQDFWARFVRFPVNASSMQSDELPDTSWVQVSESTSGVGEDAEFSENFGN